MSKSADRFRTKASMPRLNFAVRCTFEVGTKRALPVRDSGAFQ